MGQEDLASILRVDRSMVSKYEEGRHDMGPEILRRAADKFNVTPSYILFGETVIYAHRTAPVVGRVGAGAKIEAIQEDQPTLVEVPTDFENGQAFRVEGTSCAGVFEEGDIVVVRGGPRADEREFLNRFCVVQTAAGLGYLKLIERGLGIPGKGRLYNLLSPNAETLENVEITSARPVRLRIIN